MKETVKLLEAGFESSSGKTPEFLKFVKVFKKEFKKELEKHVGIKDIKFSVGHFYVSGFFTTNNDEIYYFTTPDVREYVHAIISNPYSVWCQLMYREAKDYKDYTGGVNRYVHIKPDMAEKMCWYFKTV